MRMRVLAVAVLSIVCASSAFGQGKIEIQPFVGYMYGGNIPVQTNTLNFGKISILSSLSYGVTLGYNLSDHLGVEFLWNHQGTKAEGVLTNGSIYATKVNVNLNQYHGNFLFSLRDPKEKLRPYVMFGIGGTDLSGPKSSGTRFSYSFGGGVKYSFTPHMGIRIQARYAPSYLYSVPGGVYCNWWGACFVIPNNYYLHQGDITAGWTIRF